jgi:hypothetical protein
MAACDPQAVLTENPCLTALGAFDLRVLKIATLCSIVDKLEGGAGEDCTDIQAMLTANKCLYTLTNFQLDVIETNLVCQINALL